jgi:hypothetical protein
MATSLSSRSSTDIQPTRQQLDELDALLQRMLDLPVNAAEAKPALRSEPATKETAQPTVTPDDRGRLEPRILSMPTRDATAPQAHDAGGAEADSDDEEAWVPLRSSWQPSAQTWGPLAKQWQEAQQTGQALPGGRKRSKPPAPSDADDSTEPNSVRAAPAGPKESDPRHEAGDPEQQPIPDKLSTAWQVDAHPAGEALERLPALKTLLPPPAIPPAEKRVEPNFSEEQPPLPLGLWPLAAITAVFDGCLSLLGPVTKPLRTAGGKSFLGAVGLLCLAGAAALAALDWFGWTW